MENNGYENDEFIIPVDSDGSLYNAAGTTKTQIWTFGECTLRHPVPWENVDNLVINPSL